MKITNVSVDGTVSRGIGRGADFLALAWVLRELREKAGLDPFPGTLNLKIPRETWTELYASRANFLKIDDPSSGHCPGFLLRVILEAHDGIASGYVIIPERTMHEDVLEIIAAENLRKKLNLHDGDRVHVAEAMI